MEDIRIHKTAIIHPEAKLSGGVSVGAYSIIEGNVTLKENVRVGDHCVIQGNTTIGANCQLFTGVVLGSIPQDKKFNGDDRVFLVIGKNNIFREYVTVNMGTPEGGGKTVIGDNNLLMAYSHVAHDCVIGNNCVLANLASLAGHVILEDTVVIGGLTGIHQFVRLGRLSMVGGLSRVNQDIPPFSLCVGQPARVYNTNSVGLKRANISLGNIKTLRRAFKLLFHSGLSRTHAIESIEQDLALCPELEHLIFFVKTSKRGVCS